MDLIEIIRQNLEKNHLIPTDGTVCAAVSGGADSLCMLYALHTIARNTRPPAPFALSCVHVHHGIRGAEADADAAFVRAFCEARQIPFTCKYVDVPAYVTSHPHTGTEEAARILRYRALEEAAGEDAVIAVAHTLEDQAETVLFHLFRGTGLPGLAGMEARRGRYIRPLLSVSRADIERCLREAGLTWKTDRTNADLDFARNRVREDILKSARLHVNERAAQHIAAAARDVTEALSCLEELCARASETCGAEIGAHDLPDGATHVKAFSVRKLRTLHPYLRTLLLQRTLQETQRHAGTDAYYQIARTHVEAVDALCLSDNGRASLDLPGRLRACRLYGRLYLYIESML